MAGLTTAEQELAELLLDQVGPLRLRNCPLDPTPLQEAFLRLRVQEVLLGGEAGGGKTLALLMAALMYTDVPGYHALLLRPSLAELELPGALIDLAHSWLRGSKAVWSGDSHSWRFPGPGRSGADGARLVFGYLDGVKDVPRYAGSSFSFVGFDELTRFDEASYRRMARVVRQADQADSLAAAPDGVTLAQVPVRVRATSNPGGKGHLWTKSRFVDPATRPDGVIFVRSRLEQNPHLDADSYRATLNVLGGAERARLLHGDWDYPDDGEIFQRDWIEQIGRNELPETVAAVRFWDFAASEPGPSAPDPDYTVGLKLERGRDGTFYITHIVRAQKTAGAVEALVQATALSDGKAVEIRLEQEGGSAGKAQIAHYKRTVLTGFRVRGIRPSGSKQVRALLVAAAAESGQVKLLPSRHADAFLDELSAFPNGAHDDCVDALAGAYEAIAVPTVRAKLSIPQGDIWEIAERAARRKGQPIPRSAAIAREQIDRQQAKYDRDAAQLGFRAYDSRHGHL